MFPLQDYCFAQPFSVPSNIKLVAMQTSCHIDTGVVPLTGRRRLINFIPANWRGIGPVNGEIIMYCVEKQLVNMKLVQICKKYQYF